MWYDFGVRLRQTLFPWGEQEGRSTLAVTLEEADAENDKLAEEVALQRLPGNRLLWIESAPWGEQWVDKAIVRLSVGRKGHQLEPIAVFKFGAQKFSGLRLNWVVDVSSLLATPIGDHRLVREVVRQNPCPRPWSIFAVNPSPANLAGYILDEIWDCMRCDGSAYIYASGQTADDFAQVASMLSTDWALRQHGGIR